MSSDAPLTWLVSDVHLSPSSPRTAAAFLQFLQAAQQTQELYLLGDIFEYWLGDDMLSTPDYGPLYRQVCDQLKTLSSNGTRLWWLHGNRDFLVREQFQASTGVHFLPDPSVVSLAGIDTLLTHGDAYCTDDQAYMAFRAQVRAPRFQTDFLAQPLAARIELIRAIRRQSALQREISDANVNALDEVCAQHSVSRLIHGHTHQSACHHHAGYSRWVLSDWDFDHASRGNYASVSRNGQITLIPFQFKA